MAVVHQLHDHSPEKWDTNHPHEFISIPAISPFPWLGRITAKRFKGSGPKSVAVSQFLYVNKVAPSEGNFIQSSGEDFLETWKPR
jgi:hypothetical protein